MTGLERISQACLRLAFWVPLAVCTWLALSPSPPDSVSRISDVALHALAFTYLTIALGLAHPSVRLLVLVVCMIGYGLFLEIAQSFEPARSAEQKDLLVDVAGITMGVALLVTWRRVGSRRRRRL